MAQQSHGICVAQCPFRDTQISACQETHKLQVCYTFSMTKLLEEAIAQAREMPEGMQDMAATVLIRCIAVARKSKLSDEQLDEVRRRRAERKPANLSLEQFADRLRRFGI